MSHITTEITPPAITALSRYEKIITPASGEPGAPGYKPEVSTAALLTGAAPDGVHAVPELGDSNKEQSASKASRTSHLNIDAYSSPVE